MRGCDEAPKPRGDCAPRGVRGVCGRLRLPWADDGRSPAAVACSGVIFSPYSGWAMVRSSSRWRSGSAAQMGSTWLASKQPETMHKCAHTVSIDTQPQSHSHTATHRHTATPPHSHTATPRQHRAPGSYPPVTLRAWVANEKQLSQGGQPLPGSDLCHVRHLVVAQVNHLQGGKHFGDGGNRGLASVPQEQLCHRRQRAGEFR